MHTYIVSLPLSAIYKYVDWTIISNGLLCKQHFGSESTIKYLIYSVSLTHN